MRSCTRCLALGSVRIRNKRPYRWAHVLVIYKRIARVIAVKHQAEQ
jgi:hypothetical protein